MTDYINEIAQTPLPFKPVATPKLKRWFDLVFTLSLLILFLPVILLITVVHVLQNLINAEYRGPLLYSEIRISKGRPFRVYKFRIFKIQAMQDYLRRYDFIQTKALEQDPNNLTFLGKILKQIYLDELPQLFNVLKGEMTLIGPRPSNEVVTWEDGRQGKFQRYLFAGGITGPFQVMKDQKERRDQTEVDMEYIIFCRDNPGWKVVVEDLKILYATLKIILRAKGI